MIKNRKIGLGTAAIGRPMYINIRDQQDPSSFNLESFKRAGKHLLTCAYEHGVRHFDTAPGYGVAEQVLLEWIDEFKPEDISVSTKWGYTYTANFNPQARTHEIKEHSLQKLNEQWELSSQLLPHLKIYQIHSATKESGVLDNDDMLYRLYDIKQQHGLELGLSVSGYNQNEIIHSALSIQLNNVDLFDSIQVTFNVFDQQFLEIHRFIKESGKKVIIKEALANGRIFPNANYPGYQKFYRYVLELAKKYDVGLDAIALRFCIDALQPYSVLSGASKQSHLSSNLRANDFRLSSEELHNIKAFATDTKSYWEERSRLKWQ